MLKILCLDEDVAGLGRLEETLKSLGHQTFAAGNVGQGLAALDQDEIDLVVTKAERLSVTAPLLIERLRHSGRRLPVILLAPEATSTGSFVPMAGPGINILNGPVDAERLRQAVDRAISAGGLDPLPVDPDPSHLSELIGNSEPVRKILRTVAAVAPTSSTVLIQGESGTGKELIVQALHKGSLRAEGPFVAVNCAALPEGLIESTLFGHERGAFTGALGRHVGAFERAHGGTLLLDEISELRLDLQAKLLRAIQEGEIERVGGSQPIPVDVRLVATSNRSLVEEVRAGRFRSDLYFRLNVIGLKIPALRERGDDIRLLSGHFLRETAAALGISAPLITEGAYRALENYAWPGNVRELKHAVERAVLLNQGGPLLPVDFYLSVDGSPLDGDPSLKDAFLEREIVSARPTPKVEAHPSPGSSLGATEDLPTLNLHELERLAILKALETTRGHRTRAAQLLGISDRTLRNKLKEEPFKDIFRRSRFPVSPAETAAPAGLSVVRFTQDGHHETESKSGRLANRLQANAIA